MKRREQRKLALQALFAIEFNSLPLEEVIQAVEEEAGASPKKTDPYLQELTSGVLANQEELDQLWVPFAQDWSLERIYNIDRILFRIALFEMYKAKEQLSPGIAINEAVELAKEFGEDESPRFINGILGSVVKAHERNNSGN